MLNYYRTATDQGVIKPSELEFDAKIIDSDPTKFFNKFRTDPKYKVLEQSLNTDLNAKRKEFGLPLAPMPQAPAQSSGSKIMVNPKTGERIQLVNGKWQKI